MTEKDFIPKTNSIALPKGDFSWEAPSNIALVKYWGKYGKQLPKNPSLSFTLKNCKTQTTLAFEPKKSLSKNFDFEVFLDGRIERGFKPKIEAFFSRIQPYLPFLKDYQFRIETKNTFPHSSGIASSASGMSALALCLMSMEKTINPSISNAYFYQKSSFLARLGSGSASRSIEGGLVVWGEHVEIEESSNLFGTEYPYKVHPVFKDYQDTILLVDKGEKKVSSTVGHILMNDHPFAKERFTQAKNNLTKLKTILEHGDLDGFVNLVESEALTLHAMMMASEPYFILMKPNTLHIINKIWGFRKATGSKICFTLDAGANVHVLFPKKEKQAVNAFIKQELSPYCQQGNFISDEVGTGAAQIS